MVAIHNQQTWARERVYQGHHRPRAPFRLHWLRISVLTSLVAFWSGVVFVALRLL